MELEGIINLGTVFFESEDFGRIWRTNCRSFRSDQIGKVFDDLFWTQAIHHDGIYYVSEDGLPRLIARLDDFRWEKRCRGLYQLPAAA